MANDTYTADVNGKVFAGRFKAGTIPNWFANLSSNQWHEISGRTKVADVDPDDDPLVNPTYPTAYWISTNGHNSVMSAWSGGLWVPNKGLYVFGGGHDDYKGNQLYLQQKETMDFERITDPTGAIGNEGVLNDGLDMSGVYFDGQPRSYHTYNNFALRNGVMWFFGGSVYSIGTAVSRPFYFDDAQNKWVMDADISVGADFGGACYDSLRDRFVIMAAGNTTVKLYNPTTKALSNSAPFFTSNTQTTWCCYDDLSDSVIYAGYGTDNRIKVFKADFSAAFTLVNQVNKPALSKSIAITGIAHDTTNRILYIRGENPSDVWKIQIPSDPFNDDFVWEQMSLSGSVTSTPANRGAYGRFFYAQDLNCIGVVDTINDSTFILPLE